jgi:hypothetical protein
VTIGMAQRAEHSRKVALDVARKNFRVKSMAPAPCGLFARILGDDLRVVALAVADLGSPTGMRNGFLTDAAGIAVHLVETKAGLAPAELEPGFEGVHDVEAAR